MKKHIPSGLVIHLSAVGCLVLVAWVVLVMGCSRSKPSADFASRPEATLEEVNQALVTWNLYKASYPTDLTELEAAPFFKKRLPTPPSGEKLVLNRNGQAQFVKE